MTERVAQSRAAINSFYRQDEELVVNRLLDQFPLTDGQDRTVKDRSAAWIGKIRSQPSERTLLEDFMQRYSLSTPEGVALMAIAECFLRVPDTDMADQIIIDKITGADWETAAQEGEKLITRFSGWGLNISEAILKQGHSVTGRMVQRLGLPVIRQAVAQAIKLLGGQFVCGRTINEAIANAKDWKEKNYAFSYDMLGEGARTADTASNYFKAYQEAIDAVGKSRKTRDLYKEDGISVKLSALHPRYEESQTDRCLPILIDRVKSLALQAKSYDMLLTLDAEEADRLELSFDIFEAVLSDPALNGYDGLGLAVQAYQKRAVKVIEYLIELARAHKKRIPIRLVKGAYWDSEIKRAQERGLDGYPVFTRKQSTDISYLVAADKMLAAHDALYPAFATHNAYTVSAILELAKKNNCKLFEFQRLHGMGQQLYDAAFSDQKEMPLCRVYAPVGVHQDLLPYLVRRLLENGANSSFVHQVYDKDTPVEKLTENPASYISALSVKQHPAIPSPAELYPGRLNSVAPDLSDREVRNKLFESVRSFKSFKKPSDISLEELQVKIGKAKNAFGQWNDKSWLDRADLLEKIADNYIKHRDELLALCIYEGKKTWGDAVAEWREAVDFCRYYAQQARLHFADPVELPGPTGESNILTVEGRGVFVCVSPWNFPLAIFTGQVVAALVTGNCVLAKPAENTPAVAQRAVELMYEAGIPKEVLQLIIGPGSKIGAAAIADLSCAGVVFTGSTETAWRIQQSLASKKSAIVPFIAETGGQNAMIVDSTALPEQIVDDVIRSAFLSAGQRCSALRVLFVQDDIAPHVTAMLSGAMKELHLGDSSDFATDIGPVIDTAAQQSLNKHAQELQSKSICQAPAAMIDGTFVTPQAFKISSIGDLKEENFGPLLHIVTYSAKDLDKVIDAINAVGFGLTLGIHTRVEDRAAYIAKRARVGNIYINRGMTGAVVGVQPFGGMNLSGTGPKAGGPHYLTRFITEKTVSINTTAAGGNTTLTTLTDTVS